ncbi:hypothetical protein Dxin01_00826 [Deinococcus xinjiangensis]|uniref:Uncharacterized protein n=1 Tax=Deinococcus xinjiangensis TaxID=457454 RepID=A0ABP9VA85_9DEIO
MSSPTPELKAAIKQLEAALERHTPGQPWRAKLNAPHQLLLRRPQALMRQQRGYTHWLTESDEALLHQLFDDSPHRQKIGTQGRVSCLGLTIQASPERLAYAVYLDTCLAVNGQLPPVVLRCGRWAFPGNRDAELEARFLEGIGKPLTAFVQKDFWMGEALFNPLHFSRQLHLDGLEGISAADFITQRCGQEVTDYVRGFIGRRD